MQKVCSECGELVSEQELNLEFKELFSTIEQGETPFTDIEESIYFNAYCTTCAKQFLIDERSGQLYIDQ